MRNCEHFSRYGLHIDGLVKVAGSWVQRLASMKDSNHPRIQTNRPNYKNKGQSFTNRTVL